MNGKQKKQRAALVVLFALITFTFIPAGLLLSGQETNVSSKAELASSEVPPQKAEEVTPPVKEVIPPDDLTPYRANVISDAGAILAHNTTMIGKDYPGQYSFVFMDRETGEVVAFNEEKVYTSASLYKLFVAYAVLSKVDQGYITLDTVIDGYTVDSLLNAAITISSNEAAVSLASFLGWDRIEGFIFTQGYEATTFNAYLNENGVAVTGTLQTTAQDVSKLLNRLHGRHLLSANSTDYFLDLLAKQQLTYALNQGLTEEVDFAHKTGILDDVSHDAGIISCNGKDYIVVAMTDGWSNATSEATPVLKRTGWAIMTFLREKERRTIK